MASVDRLVSYSESSSSEGECGSLEPTSPARFGEKRGLKRRGSLVDSSTPAEGGCSGRNSAPRDVLPVPDDIKNLFKEREVSDDPSKHGGRVRTFPHLEGNWATYVFIPVSVEQNLLDLQEQFLRCLQPCAKFTCMADYHISLSRTVSIRHHWIQPLMDSLRARLRHLKSCVYEFHSVKFYTNEEKSRSFVGLEMDSGADAFIEYTTVVNECFREFNLKEFYKIPSFHLSIGWSMGDVLQKISSNIKEKLQDTFDDFLLFHPSSFRIPVKEVQCQTGNKIYSFPLTEK